MKVKISELQDLGLRALKKRKYSKKEASDILEVLMYSQTRNGNQGLAKLVGGGYAKSPNAKKPEVMRKTKLSMLLNGNHTAGILVLKKATEIAIKNAKKKGFYIVGTNNTSTSTGSLGYYADKIAQEGLIAFVFASSPQNVAMHGSYEPIFGTNPLAIGVPTEGDPVILDMATSAMTYFGLIEAKTAGRQLPPNTAYDKEGRITTDPAKALEGGLMTFDRSYKGAGLSMMVEILGGPLVQAAFSTIGDVANNWGNLVFAIDPSLLTDSATFRKNVTAMVNRVKTTKRLSGVDEIFVPGEKGNKTSRRQGESGEVEMEEKLYEEIKKAASGR